MIINKLKFNKGCFLVLFLLAIACSVNGFGQTGEEYYKKGKDEYYANHYKTAIKYFDTSILKNSKFDSGYFRRGQ